MMPPGETGKSCKKPAYAGFLFYDTARVMYLSALRLTRTVRGQMEAGPPLPY